MIPSAGIEGSPAIEFRVPLGASRSGTRNMRIAVMGSGGLGGYFGARLVMGGSDVTFIARGGHLSAMQDRGLSIEGPEPIHIPHVRAVNDPAAAGVSDFVIFAVKLWDTEEALRLIAPMV